MSIDASIDRMCEALASLGFDVAPGPDDAAAWETLDRELTPLALPSDLRRLLQRVDVARLPLRIYPDPSMLSFALGGWRMLRDGNLAFPAGLFPWCYAGHNHLLVELDGPGIDGGAMFEWGFGGSQFKLRFRSPADWVETAVAVLHNEWFERHGNGDQATLLADDDRWLELAVARLEAGQPHQIYGHQVSFEEDEQSWPQHWETAAVLARKESPPEYPPMTVAQVLSRRRTETVRAFVTGYGSYLFGRAGQDTRIWLTDDTGLLDILCPVEIRGHAAIRTTRAPISVELIAERRSAPLPPIDWDALTTPFAGGTTGAARLLAHQPPDATATVIHPPK